MHPFRLLQAVGISEIPAGIATAIVVLLQYVLVLKLWEGYIVQNVGKHIHSTVAVTGSALSIAGVLVIIGISLYRWHRGSHAARQLERPATHASFEPIVDALDRVSKRSELESSPALLYTPKNAVALEVRHDRNFPQGAIVVGLHQRARQKEQAMAFDAQLGHEVSHLEIRTTAREILVRRGYSLHTRSLAWVVAVFALTLGFIDPGGLSSDTPYSGFMPVFSSMVYTGLPAQLLVLVLTWLIVLIFTHFYLVRREHLHDIRGSQLAGNDSLETQVFDPQSRTAAWFDPLVDFFALHPTASQRSAILRRRDVILLSVAFYPFVVVGLQAYILLLAGWPSFFAIELVWWNLGLTVFSGCLLYLLLAADLRRLALGTLLRRNAIVWQIPAYAFFAALATQLPRVLLEFVYGVRQGDMINEIVTRILFGLLSGGSNIIITMFVLLVASTYLYGVRLAANGERRFVGSRIIDHVAGLLLVTGGFVSISLTTDAYRLHTLTGIIGVVLVVVLLTSVSSRCGVCRRRLWGSLWLRAECACGNDTLPILRYLESHEFAEPQVDPAADK